jgi:hypothetical protein
MQAEGLLPIRAIINYIRSSFWEALNYALGMALFGFGVYTLTVSSFWIGYIGEMTQGLTEVGYISNLEGSSTRRTYHDTIWLNLSKNKKVYNYDTIATSKNTTLEITLDNIKITIAENSLVRIKNINGKPVIRVARGVVSADVGEGAQLLVQTTMRKTEVQRGRYLLTSDNPPEAEENEADGDIANGLRQAKPIPVTEGASITVLPHEEGELKERIATADKETKVISEWKLPTPTDGQLFLVQKHGTILLGYQESCDDNCKIVIYQNERIVKEFNFKPNEQSIIHVSTRDLPDGEFIWQFVSTKKTYKARFEIQPYSQERMFENLNLKRSFEILN